MRKLFLLPFSFLLFLTACTKIDSTSIGSGLIPAVDNITTFDSTFAVVTNTQSSEVIPTVYKNDDHVIGNLNDPLFGTTKGSVFFELKPSFFPYFFQGEKSTIVADSADLFLTYTGAYGDTSAATPNQNWEIREISRQAPFVWKGDSAYNTQVNPPLGSVIKTETINIRNVTQNKDSLTTRFETLVPNIIRIKLPVAFAQRLIKTYDSTDAYKSDSVFRERFGGFAIVPTGSQGNTLVRINLLAANTKLALYYHSKATTTATTVDTLVNYFVFNSQLPASSSANRVERNYAGSQLAAVVGNNAVTDRVFIQTAPGTFANVTIPGLSGLPKSIIHRAELIIEQEQTGDNLFDVLTPPRYLLLSAYDATNKVKKSVAPDYDVSQGVPNLETFGGFLFYKNITGFNSPVASYSFNISRYVQGIVTKKDSSYPLRISAPANDSIQASQPYFSDGFTKLFYITPSTANVVAHGRVRLGGGSHPNPAIRMRLRIIYSKI